MIVVKSVIVPVANIVSNFFQLLNRGVPLQQIVKGAGRKVAELNFYIKSRDKEPMCGPSRAALLKQTSNLQSVLDDAARNLAHSPVPLI